MMIEKMRVSVESFAIVTIIENVVKLTMGGGDFTTHNSHKQVHIHTHMYEHMFESVYIHTYIQM